MLPNPAFLECPAFWIARAAVTDNVTVCFITVHITATPRADWPVFHHWSAGCIGKLFPTPHTEEPLLACPCPPIPIVSIAFAIGTPAFGRFYFSRAHHRLDGWDTTGGLPAPPSPSHPRPLNNNMVAVNIPKNKPIPNKRKAVSESKRLFIH